MRNVNRLNYRERWILTIMHCRLSCKAPALYLLHVQDTPLRLAAFILSIINTDSTAWRKASLNCLVFSISLILCTLEVALPVPLCTTGGGSESLWSTSSGDDWSDCQVKWKETYFCWHSDLCCSVTSRNGSSEGEVTSAQTALSHRRQCWVMAVEEELKILYRQAPLYYPLQQLGGAVLKQ